MTYAQSARAKWSGSFHWWLEGWKARASGAVMDPRGARMSERDVHAWQDGHREAMQATTGASWAALGIDWR